LRRALLKRHLRVVGVDDGAFTRRHRYAPLIAVVWSGPETVEGVGIDRVQVDGTDATDRVLALVRARPQFEGLRAVLLDGVVLGGFNVVDLDRLSAGLDLLIVAVTRERPDFLKIQRALRRYFPRDHARRYRLVRRQPLFEVPTPGAPILAACAGCSPADAISLVQRTTRTGHWPEPLRLAHLIGHAVGGPGGRPRSRARRSTGP
jgi:uncharacterized protein